MRWSGSFSLVRSNRGILGDDKEKVKRLMSDDRLTLQEEQQSLFFYMAALSSPEGREMTSLNKKKLERVKKRCEMKKMLCRGNTPRHSTTRSYLGSASNLYTELPEQTSFSGLSSVMSVLFLSSCQACFFCFFVTTGFFFLSSLSFSLPPPPPFPKFLSFNGAFFSFPGERERQRERATKYLMHMLQKNTCTVYL